MIVELEGLTKKYGDTAAVGGLSFAVEADRIVGFLGRNGAGKSTTIKMLLGMITPTSGRARVLGHPVDDPRASLEIRRRVAYVGEDKGLYPYMTVAELIAFTRSFYADWDREREARLLAQYDLPPTRKVKALSKGMRTKLALLLALARRPADPRRADRGPRSGLDRGAAARARRAERRGHHGVLLVAPAGRGRTHRG